MGEGSEEKKMVFDFDKTAVRSAFDNLLFKISFIKIRLNHFSFFLLFSQHNFSLSPRDYQNVGVQKNRLSRGYRYLAIERNGYILLKY